MACYELEVSVGPFCPYIFSLGDLICTHGLHHHFEMNDFQIFISTVFPELQTLKVSDLSHLM